MARLTIVITGVLVGLLAVSPALQAQTQAEVLQEQRAVGLVRALKGRDATNVVTYLEQHLAPDTWQRRTPDQWRQMASRLIQSFGSADIDGVDIKEPNSVSVVMAREGGGMATLGFEFEPSSPHRITSIAVEMGGPAERGESPYPPMALPPGATRAQVTGALERYLADLAARDLFSGTLLLAHRGDVLFTAAHGMASKRFAAPNRLDTRFDLGSINKEFTKIAVAQLMEAGKLSLSDKLIEHLPDYPNRAVAERVTVGHLVEHTSGLGDIFNEKFRQMSRAMLREPRDYFPIFADEPLQFEPGAGRAYSNAGYIVLGAVVEAASGEAYDTYVQRHIFAPAGMTQSGFFERDVPVPNVAEGYTRMMSGPGTERRSNAHMLPIKGNPAGSAQSTVEDLFRFDTALREHRLVSAPYTDWVLGGSVPAPGREVVGAAPRATGFLGIAGGGPGVSATLESDGEFVLVVLSNYDPPGAEGVARRVWEPLRRALR